MMTTPKVYKTEAIVLRHAEFGEADRILTLYTLYSGKLRAIAKGVRKPTSKIGGHVESLTHCSLMLSRGQNLDIITQSQTINSFLPIRRDLWRTSCALYLAELVDAFAAENVENQPIFRLLLDAFHRLGEVRHTELILRYFELHLLSYLGYCPELQECLNCKSPLEPVVNLFSASGGGVLCPACADTEPVTSPISVNVLKVLRFFQNSDLATACHLKLSPELSRELEGLLRQYIRYLLERELKSTEFLNRLKEDFVNDLPR
jgi:DNA repair protein RecO (recombination protein O)